MGIENRLDGASRRIRIVKIADGGRQRKVIREIPAYIYLGTHPLSPSAAQAVG